jgi:hypothetical protein
MKYEPYDLVNIKIDKDDYHRISVYVRVSVSHCQIDCQILFDNCHLNFRNTDARQN